MSIISIRKTSLKNKEATGFSDDFIFDIELDCFNNNIPIDAEVKFDFIYVYPDDQNQVEKNLGSYGISSIKPGQNVFTISVPGPDPFQIPAKTRYELSGLYLKCIYKKQEFVRIGYYVKFELDKEYEAYLTQLGPDANVEVDVSKVRRELLEEDVRVTRYAIDWGMNNGAEKGDDLMEDESSTDENTTELNAMKDDRNLEEAEVHEPEAEECGPGM